MTGRQGWRRVDFHGVALEVPVDMAASTEQGVEGDVLVLEGAGLRLTLDASLFRDRLHGAASRPGSRRWSEPVGDDAREVVAFDAGDGTVLVADLPGDLTASVHVDTGGDQGSALDIIRSITQQGDRDV